MKRLLLILVISLTYDCCWARKLERKWRNDNKCKSCYSNLVTLLEIKYSLSASRSQYLVEKDGSSLSILFEKPWKLRNIT